MQILATEPGELIAAFGVGLVVLVGIVALYLLPTIIASRRGHHQTAPIAVVNICFGWTLLGWVAALAWSVSAVRPIAA